MVNFLIVVILIALLGVCLLQLQKLGMIDLPVSNVLGSDADDKKSDG